MRNPIDEYGENIKTANTLRNKNTKRKSGRLTMGTVTSSKIPTLCYQYKIMILC